MRGEKGELSRARGRSSNVLWLNSPVRAAYVILRHSDIHVTAGKYVLFLGLLVCKCWAQASIVLFLGLKARFNTIRRFRARQDAPMTS